MQKLIGAIIKKGDKVLVERRKDSDDFGGGELWVIGGHVEKDETEEDAFVREVKEELDIVPLEYKQVCVLPWVRDGKQYSVTYFAFDRWKGNIKNKEAEKLIWLSKKEINKLDVDIDKKALKLCFRN
jgi:8-oxo-dGTP diphosphatase